MEYLYGVIIIVGLYVILATSFNLIIGYGGLVSIAHPVFFALGAYSSVAVHKLFPLPVPALIVIGGVISGIVGLGTGYLTLRLRGAFFSIATLALAEAYGVVDDPRLGPALEKAVRLIINSQDKNSMGAWRYSPESGDADTTVSGAQMVALFAARNAGIAVKEENIQKGLRFFARCQTAEGGMGYTSNTGPNGTRTAIGCLVYSLAKDKNNPVYQNAFKYLQRAPQEMSYREYNLYYVSQAFFQAGPQYWRDWNLRNIKSLTASQNADGSWDQPESLALSNASRLRMLAAA